MSGTRIPDLTPDWVDPVAVDRALSGWPVGRPLHHAERVEVAHRVIAAGDGYNRVMDILDCSAGTVARLVSEERPAVGAVVS